MKFETTRFGEVEVSEENIITAPEGLLGYYDQFSWTFIDEERAAPFRMLQSLDTPALAFTVVDPLVVYQDYFFEITQEDLRKLCKPNHIQVNTDNLQTYCIIDIRKGKPIHDVTINLQGPVVVNTVSRMLHQFVLIDTEYTTRMPLLTRKED